jgi:hypothetical protein
MSYALAGEKQKCKHQVFRIWKAINAFRQSQKPKGKYFTKEEALDMHIEKGHEVILKELLAEGHEVVLKALKEQKQQV